MLIVKLLSHSNKTFTLLAVFLLSGGYFSMACASNSEQDIFRYAGGSCKLGRANCFKADFDGNGVIDYVVPIGEGWIAVHMNVASEKATIHELDAGGVAEIYPARTKTGEHGEPALKNPAILVTWVGQNHVVFAWNNGGFKKIIFPAFAN